jgi:hypothetical protein
MARHSADVRVLPLALQCSRSRHLFSSVHHMIGHAICVRLAVPAQMLARYAAATLEHARALPLHRAPHGQAAPLVWTYIWLLAMVLSYTIVLQVVPHEDSKS